MAADLFETYAVTAIAAMILGNLTVPGPRRRALSAALDRRRCRSSLRSSAFSSSASARASPSWARSIKGWLPRVFSRSSVSVFLAQLLCFLHAKFRAALLSDAYRHSWSPGSIVLITEYYTSKKFRPVRSIAQVVGNGTWHEHHHGTFGQHGIDGTSGHRHCRRDAYRLCHIRSLRYRARDHEHACHGGYHRRNRCVRAYHR